MLSCIWIWLDIAELDGPAFSALRRAIVEVKQRWSDIGWVTKSLLSRAPPCCGRHVNLLVPAAFAVVSTHQPALGPHDELCVIHREGLCPSSRDNNGLMVMTCTNRALYAPRIAKLTHLIRRVWILWTVRVQKKNAQFAYEYVKKCP
jgi:hypothetical protein